MIFLFRFFNFLGLVYLEKKIYMKRDFNLSEHYYLFITTNKKEIFYFFDNDNKKNYYPLWSNFKYLSLERIKVIVNILLGNKPFEDLSNLKFKYYNEYIRILSYPKHCILSNYNQFEEILKLEKYKLNLKEPSETILFLMEKFNLHKNESFLEAINNFYKDDTLY